MRRLITHTALLAVAAVAVWRSAIDTPAPFISGSQLLAAEREPEVVRDSSATFVSLPGGAGVRLAIPELTPERHRLIELLKAKVQLMNDEQVQKALESTDAEIRVMQADARVR